MTTTEMFGVPFYYGDFNAEDISLDYKLDTKWRSETPSSFNVVNTLDKTSAEKLLKEISNYTNTVIRVPHRLRLQECWRNEYGYRDQQEVHLHAHSHFSFTIFKDIPKDCGNIIFFHPAKDLMYNFEEKDMLIQEISPQPKPNKLLIWPSFIKHMVTPNNNKTEKRVTYSGNVWIERFEQNENNKL